MQRLALSLLALSGMALTGLAACGEKGDVACCAIEPSAKCESQMLGKGVTREEFRIVKETMGGTCPSVTVDEARIRAIARIADEAGCLNPSRSYILQRLESDACGGGAN